MKSCFRWLFLLPLLVSGCVTMQHRVDYSYLQASYGVDKAVTAKMQGRAPLEIADLVHLAEREVPDPVVIEYLKRLRAAYRLDADQVESLLEGGVSHDVVDHLLSANVVIRRVHVHPYYWYGPRPLFHYRAGFYYPYW